MSSNQFNNYPLSYYGTIVSLLGRGTYGEVYSTSQKYAIKILQRPSEYLTMEILNDLLFPPILDHPNIISYHGVYLDSDAIIMVMDWAHSDFGKLKGIPECRNPILFHKIASQLSSAVVYLAENGIIHRDIKPENILVYSDEKDFRCVLTDFGLVYGQALIAEVDDERVYTLPYRPPEVLLGSQYDSRADIWALGCTLYEIYTGCRLFSGVTEIEVLFDIYRHLGMVDLNSSIYSLFQDVIKNEDSNKQEQLISNSDTINALICRMVNLAPETRMTISELKEYFDIEVTPFSGNKFPDYSSWILNLNVPISEFSNIIDWIRSIRNNLVSSEIAFHYGISIIYRFLPYCTPKDNYKLIGMACMYIAMTWKEVEYQTYDYYLDFVESGTFSEFVLTIDRILMTFNFKMNFQSPCDILLLSRHTYSSKIIEDALNILSLTASIPKLYFDPHISDHCLNLVQCDKLEPTELVLELQNYYKLSDISIFPTLE